MRLHLAVAAAALLLAAGCAGSPGSPAEAVSGAWTPTLVAGLPVVDGPDGLRSRAPDPVSHADGSDGGTVDLLALSALDDIQAYWAATLPALFGRAFTPIREAASYASGEPGDPICGIPISGQVNAFYCTGSDTVVWDRDALLPRLRAHFGDIAVLTVIAHEAGHAVQARLGDDRGELPAAVKELQADCYAGAYFRWAAEGHSPRFRVSTGSGLANALGTLFLIRGVTGLTFGPDNSYGTAFDRAAAFRRGFGDGPVRCRRIGRPTVSAAVADVDRTRVQLDGHTLATMETSLHDAFPSTGATRITPDATSCRGRPAAYCPDLDLVGVDLRKLRILGTPAPDGGFGDFGALAEVASRFTLSAQRAGGVPVRGLPAALRSACLTGAWLEAARTAGPDGLRPSQADIDEAAGRMLSSASLIAADGYDLRVPSGFARVEAFRDGLGGATCLTHFR